MALDKPASEDLSKLHGEINQYINQRFTIAMTAITFFGIVGGWMVSSLPSFTSGQPQVRPVTFLIATVLLVVLLVLFVYSQVLRGSLVVLAAYLRVTKTSPWEKDFQKFYRHPKRPKFVRQEDSQALLFFILGFIIGPMPFALQGAQLGKLSGIPVVAPVLVIVWISYLVMVVLVWREVLFHFATDAETLWEEIAAESDNPSHLGGESQMATPDNPKIKPSEPARKPRRGVPPNDTSP